MCVWGGVVVHWISQPVRDWQIDCIGPLPPSKGPKYALVSEYDLFGLTQLSPVATRARLPPLGD